MTSIDLYADFDEENDARINYDDDERPDNDEENNGSNNNDDGADDEEKKDVEAKIKAARPRRKLQTLNALLNAERLKGPRGIVAVEDFFKDIKFKGKGYEKQDLDAVMTRLEHWAHRMFPKYNFDDSLTTIERLGKKREIQTYMHRYRLDQLLPVSDEQVLTDDEGADDRDKEGQAFDEPMDEFDVLINEQIALTTLHSRTNDGDQSFGNISGISGLHGNVSSSTQLSQPVQQLSQPQPSQALPSSQQTPSQPEQASQPPLSDEVRARIAENKGRAMAILEQRKKEAEEKQRQKELEEERSRYQEISNIIIDDDF